MLNWYILQGTTMKTWLCFQITCFSTSLTWSYNKKLQWWMILMAVQLKHWNSFWKQHPHQWQKDWRIGKLKQQMDETFLKERTIYQEIWTYNEKQWKAFMIMKQQDTQAKLGHIERRSILGEKNGQVKRIMIVLLLSTIYNNVRDNNKDNDKKKK